MHVVRGMEFFQLSGNAGKSSISQNNPKQKKQKKPHKAKNNQPTNLPPAKLLRYMEAFFHLITTSLGLLLFKLLLLSVLPTGE